MRIIKLNAIDSTNTYLKQLCSQMPVEDYTAVMTKHQTMGRGQMGSVWTTESAKNLTFSVYKDISGWDLKYPFYMSMATALALVKTLESLSIPKIKVKWPNDILSENKKVCGVLIENVIKSGQYSSSVIGIGLNVNQTQFEDLPKASSLRIISGRNFDLDEIAQRIIDQLKTFFKMIGNGELEHLKYLYESYLFRKDKPSTFKNAEGVVFSGIIKHVSNTGTLEVLLEDDNIKSFDLKTITLLY
ncbi:biotin--[acetyl-CoA-carboxylase] ligase [Aestuariibaculum sediminum]|uniref:Biotin--[acetyl-CoA-carboxylase] ligase n=1 Tax=Aestuariibaculum sediminum TaxID=2770637 RepID=A0A8J6U6M9_9FLAO|nr:biotin--[acetyl-CoA-carboxylase] ligase [Aestuariibaculum sediminum]MBD0830653.1 biotin--[acetyl-CoA-carboxylase] ligase [Aestuariibaculum sediminum]